MKEYENIFLKAMKASITNQTFNETLDNFHEWQALYSLTQVHQVSPLIYDILYTYEIPEMIKVMWKKQSFQMITLQVKKTMEFMQVYNLLRKEHIKPLIFKGLICRNTYPKPDLRISGDEDILVQKEDLNKVDQLLINLGFTRDKDITDNIEEVGYRNLNTGLYIEVHVELFSKDSVYSFLNNEFNDVFNHSIEIDIDSCSFLTFDYTDHLFYLFCHSYKHFVHGGFGIRQLCDMIQYMKKYSSYIDYDEYNKKIYKYNFQDLWYNLLDIAEKYLGFSYEEVDYSKPNISLDSNDLLIDLLDSGIFGRSTLERTHSSTMTLNALKDNHSSMLSNILHSLFPDYKYMKSQYKYLNNNPYLLPFSYIQRIISYLIKKKKSKEKNNSISLGKHRIELLKKYKLIK